MKTLETALNPTREQLNTNATQVPEGSVNSDFLTLCYIPSQDYLETHWKRPVSSEEYRQGIRSIAVCVATLHARKLLVNFIEIGTPSLADQNWTATFLKNAIKQSSLQSCARILTNELSQAFANEVVEDKVQQFPYDSRVFASETEAKKWLLQERQLDPVQDKCIYIPLNFKLQFLRKISLKPAPVAEEPKPAQVKAKESEAITKCRTDFVEITIDRKQSLLTVKWLRAPKSREYRYGVLKSNRAMIDYRLEKKLVYNTKLGLLSIADQAWLVYMATTLAHRHKLKRLAIISAPDSLQQTMSDAMCYKLQQADLPYAFEYFLSEKEAMGWLQA